MPAYERYLRRNWRETGYTGHVVHPANVREPGTAESRSRTGEFLGRALMLLAEYGASSHPATAAQFYADKAEVERHEAEVAAFRRQLETVTAKDLRD